MGQGVSIEAQAFAQAVQEGQTAAIADVLSRDPTLATADVDKVSPGTAGRPANCAAA